MIQTPLKNHTYMNFLSSSMNTISSCKPIMAALAFGAVLLVSGEMPWILIKQDRNSVNTIQASHQIIADSLGVRREAVLNAMSKLDGISYRRCEITVEDYSLLKQQSCECYSAQRGIHPFQMNFPF